MEVKLVTTIKVLHTGEHLATIKMIPRMMMLQSTVTNH